MYVSYICNYLHIYLGFPGGTSGKEPAGDIKDVGSIPSSRGAPGGGHGNPVQYSCLENPMDRGAWQTTVHGVTKSLADYSPWGHKESDTAEVTYHTCTYIFIYLNMCVLRCFSRVQLYATPWTIICQTPPSMGLARQEY